ncbi:MAG: lipopolysaccharide transport periplasmic protein LptA [Alphaproteobacteria bacterium]|nr:lipopolysaccharide transport periplasmic protein LptA [Alphaproteobacteria bacterium]
MLSKFRALIWRSNRILCCAMVMAFGSMGAGGAWAEKADRDRPMNIEADRLDHDEQKKTTVFQGRVIATKGSIVLRGHTLEVRQDPDGTQHGVLLPNAGERAFYRQKREGVAEFMEAEAERIEFDGRRDRVTLTGRAELRRLRGNTLADEIQGQVIVYDNLNDQFTVDGAARGGQRTEPVSRVRAVLSPKPREGLAR